MAEAAAAPLMLRVTVAACTAPGVVQEWCGEVPEGAPVSEALRLASGCGADRSTDVGIWGKKVALTRVLREGDRVEVYRPLRVDPKVARRERFARQGLRSAGLFARKPAAES